MLKKCKDVDIWRIIIGSAFLISVLAAFAGYKLPQWFFYETKQYYGTHLFQRNGMFEKIQDYTFFIHIRAGIPMVFFLVTMLKKRGIFLYLYMLERFFETSFLIVLLFGSGGMKHVFFYAMAKVLSESFYLLSGVEVYFYTKSEKTDKKFFFFCFAKSFFYLISGIIAEVLFFI